MKSILFVIVVMFGFQAYAENLEVSETPVGLGDF